MIIYYYFKGDIVGGPGAVPPEHHQLLHRLPGGGGPLCGRHRHALLRLHHGGCCVVILSAGAWRGLRLLDRLQLFINKLSIVLRLKVYLGCWEENRLPVETNCANSTKCLSGRSC